MYYNNIQHSLYLYVEKYLLYNLIFNITFLAIKNPAKSRMPL